jgi:hypothetical protein
VNPFQFLADLDRLGIRIESRGEQLRYSPRSAMTPDLLGRLKAHKAELLAILRGETGDPGLNPEPHTAPAGMVGGLIDDDDPFGPRLKIPQRDTGPEPVCRCGSTTWRDIPIHDGQSTRRDCARCRRFIGFTRWYGNDLTDCPQTIVKGDP